MHFLYSWFSKFWFLLAVLLVLSACAGTANIEPSPAATAGPALVPTAEPAVSSTIAGASDPAPVSAEKYAELEMVTLLPRDAIPAIDNPQFLEADEADNYYNPDELIIGVEFEGDARAYSVPFLSNHEIVNDTVGGVKIAVTW